MRPAVYAALQQEQFSGGKTVDEPSDAEFLRLFATTRSEAAFEALVRRHGPMVEGVCRRILGEVHSAEDAFQAVFMILVRKSASIRRPELLANWLYGVACRIARKAKISALRKESRERRAGRMPTQEQQLLDLEWAELKAVLDEELSQLPEKYRAPLVLCYLCGQTNAQAAAQLGWPSGSMSERLSRAREMLRKRLNRRGLTLSAGLLALLLTNKASSAAVSPLLVEATVKSGMSYSAKTVAAGSVSPNLLELVSESDGLSVVRTLKLLALALVIALPIATGWPRLKAISERTVWYLTEGLGWNAGQFNASVQGGATSTNVGASGSGAHCSGGSR
jgi:RNA polymerase sigma-70 factor (ECF subfamily)